jgi:hypothetical protein
VVNSTNISAKIMNDGNALECLSLATFLSLV